MDADQFLDEFLAKRGIPAELAAARGYTAWSPETGADVIEDAFDGFHTGGLRWLKRVAGNEDNGFGFTIPRFPVPLPRAAHVFPEIKTEFAVKMGQKRHYHGSPVFFAELLPSIVISTKCVPKMGYVKVYFTHEHSSLGAQESPMGQLACRADHLSTWHGMNVPNDAHRHCLTVFKPEAMQDHVAYEGEKYSNAHEGTNANTIHVHVAAAKYLLPPNSSTERIWNGKHSHEHLNEEQLARHLACKDHE